MKRFILLLCVGLAAPIGASGTEIPAYTKKCVAFIFAPISATNDVPDGTGFFIMVPHAKTTNHFFNYFVTAKHVLRPPPANLWLKQVLVRLNRRNGSAEKVPLPLFPEGPNQNVFVHPDPTVDLAVIPFAPSQDTFEYTALIEANWLTPQLFAANFREGSEAYFIGMFPYHLGTKRNMPITRFARVSMVSDEKIPFLGENRDLYIFEAGAYPGNSGAPLFFLTGYENPPGVQLGAPRDSILGGVIFGHFNDAVLVKEIPTGYTNATFPSLGITAVTPASKLYEILYEGELKARREP